MRVYPSVYSECIYVLAQRYLKVFAVPFKRTNAFLLQYDITNKCVGWDGVPLLSYIRANGQNAQQYMYTHTHTHQYHSQ